MKDHKDVFNDAYADAIDSGLPVESAERIANEAMTGHVSGVLEAADNLRKERRENGS